MNLKPDNIKLSLKKMYYVLFVSFIVIPLLIVLLVSLLVLNQQFKEQAIENIQKTQENIATELLLDAQTMSLRLSHLVHTNNNEMLDYASSYAGTDDTTQRYEYQQKLQESGNLALEPSSNIISVGFYMKDGKKTYIKNEVSIPEIENTTWYRQALQDKNQVYVGAYHIKEKNEAFIGSKGKSLLLVFALAPDRTTDRNEKIEMVVVYYATNLADKIVSYNKQYLSGDNNLGSMQIVDAEGNLIFSSNGEQIQEKKGYTSIRTAVDLHNTTWYVENYIETDKLTNEFWQIASVILAVAICILAFAAYFSRYLIKSIVSPIEEISEGFKRIEGGDLDVHIAVQGQSEIRNMIHQFNAMVRRLKVLIGEYEEQVRNARANPTGYFTAMLRKEMTPQEVAEKNKAFFAEKYVLLGLYLENKVPIENNAELMAELFKCCERNPRFASRCIVYVDNNNLMYALYRVTEPEYNDTVAKMLQDIQQEAYKRLDEQVCVCVSKLVNGPDEFYTCVEDVKEHLCFKCLYGENAIIDLKKDEEMIARIDGEVHNFYKFAEALYIADEKNVFDEKERIFASFIHQDIEEIKITVLAVVLAIGNTFGKDDGGFLAVFGKQSNYIEKIGRINEVRSLKLWLTNYCAWILNYSASKLKVSETDVIVKAKRYIAEHCEDAELSLAEVADYVELNEKYFTNRFTNETGETFSSYLTALRMQRAKELLKTTTFKIYEISEMVGYRNVEHFNRVFKKWNQMTPAQYRKNM